MNFFWVPDVSAMDALYGFTYFKIITPQTAEIVRKKWIGVVSSKRMEWNVNESNKTLKIN